MVLEAVVCLTDLSSSLRRGEGQAGPGVPSEEHQPGDQGDLSRALQGIQRRPAAGVHHEGARGQEDGQTQRRE